MPRGAAETHPHCDAAATAMQGVRIPRSASKVDQRATEGSAALSTATAAQRRYWTRVIALGCVITHGPAEICHCHGGSIADLGIYRGKGTKPSNWLVLPLAPRLHRAEYKGLDYDVRAWEAENGTQVDFLKMIGRQLGINQFELAAAEEKRSLPILGARIWTGTLST